jgi:UDP-2,3-diacylglucosamine pyrophosphatase LpxH
MKTLVMSDIHVGSKGCQTEAVLDLLKDESYDRYILVGDIIDGWLFKRYKKFSYEHAKIIRRFLKISKHKEIIWIAGNHDEFLRKYMPMEIGNIKIVDEWKEEGIWFCHGDRYDGVVKMRWLAMLGGFGYDTAIVLDRFLKKLGLKRSLSKFLKDNVKAAIKFMVDFENEMVRQAEKRGCHTVICGHIHKPEMKKIGGVNYVNTGDWVENNSHVVIDYNFLSIKLFSHGKRINSGNPLQK